MKHSDSIVNISKALVEVQKKLKNPKQTASNPFYHSSYAPLNEIMDDIRPICNEHGITVLHDIAHDNGSVIVSAMLLHSSGEWIQTEGMKLPMDKNTAQGAGSAVTYGRRYTITAILGVASDEDDDGNQGEKTANRIKKEFHGQELTPKQKYDALGEKVRNGFKLTGWKTKDIMDKCILYNFDEEKLLKDINAVLDKKGAA